jgi:hypothetical protein
MRRLSGGWSLAIAVVIAGCQYKAPNNSGDDDVPPDGPPPLPDAGPCPEVSKQCFTSGDTTVLQNCEAVGENPIIETCAWGCLDDATPHCGELRPSGNVLDVADLRPRPDDAMLLPITIATPAEIDTATGEIVGIRTAGIGVISGIGFEARPGGGVFRFKSLVINERLDVANSNALAIVGLESITVNAEVDLSRCGGGQVSPGGFLGGAPNQPGGGGTGGGAQGAGGNDDSSGGGGGANAGNGGTGGGGATQAKPAGGTAFGDAAITALVGGGGGGGGGNTGGRGGNGGGAIQLISNGTISITGEGSINAGGCGGQAGQNQRAAGGGGAGGAILIEAPTVSLAAEAVVAANGGGGGGGDQDGVNGQDARSSATAATGGNPGSKGGRGGDGAVADVFAGAAGNDDDNGGGGGGGVGWIRFDTRTGTITIDQLAIVSPTISLGSPASVSTADLE